VGWIDTELALVSLAALFSPTTLTWSVLALVLGERPLRTGAWFYLGAITATLAVGVAASFLVGDFAAHSHSGGRKTWVSIFDIVVGAALLVYVVRTWRTPFSEKTTQSMTEKMSTLAASPWVAVIAAGATLANPGAFIPVALKTISETDPSTAGFAVEWIFFTIVSLLPLAIALILLLVSKDWTERLLRGVRIWLLGHLRLIASLIIVLLAFTLLRNGISGLTS
jgi:hypothetical protein